MLVFINDLRHTWRRARRFPGITFSVVFLLILGVVSVTTVFNAVYSTLYSPLLLPKPEQLVRIGGNIPLFNTFSGSFIHEDSLNRIFSNITCYYMPSNSKIRISAPETGKYREVYHISVDKDFFATMGVSPLLGHDFKRSENTSGVVISYRLWRDILMGADDVIGKSILVDARQVDIIGIMPNNFNFPINIDVWQYDGPRSLTGLTSNPLQFVGRLHSGVSNQQASRDLNDISLKPQPAGTLSKDGPVLQPLQAFIYGDQRPMLRMFSAAAILFFALVSTGVVNLLIAQGTNRKQEIAIRLAHGASRRGLVFQMLKETLPLVVIGGLAGLWLSEIASAWLWANLPALRHNVVSIPTKIAFGTVVVLIVTLIGGMVPSLYATGLNINTYLKSANNGKRRFFSTQEFLVCLQFSLALALLICVGILSRSMMFRVDFPIGWSSRQVVVVSAHPLSDVTLSELFAARQLYINSHQAVQRELSTLSGVMAVGSFLPIPFSSDAIMRARNRMPVSATEPIAGLLPVGSPQCLQVNVSPGGFGILGIPLFAGRYFTEEDVVKRHEIVARGAFDDGGVAIINLALAQQLWPGENAIGKIIYQSNLAFYEVVGVIQNFYQIPETGFIPTIYIPNTIASPNYDFLVELHPGVSLQSFQLNVRQSISNQTVVPTAFEIQPLSEYVKDSTVNQRLTLQLLGWFTLLGVVITVVGVYAITVLMIEARTKEIGIRIAIGARNIDIFRFMLWRGFRIIILIGLPFGLLIALILTKALSSFLLYVNIEDIVTWIFSCILLICITIVAITVPILRVLHINPLDALRSE